ncbi:MAG: hypothetical protein ACRDFS_05270 [Chloroflexota bacterium]
MNDPLKSLRVNLMYWRFRYITRNRMRLQAAWYRHRQPHNRTYAQQQFKPRGSASTLYRSSATRTWIIFVAMVIILTIFSVAGTQTTVNGTLLYGLMALTVVGAIYLALRGQ